MTKTARRSVFVRSGQLPSIRLTLRDKDIAQLVHSFGVATTRQIQKLVFPESSLRACNRRLQKLWLCGYLERVFVPQVLASNLMHPSPRVIYYCLTAKGGRELARTGDNRALNRKRPSFFFLQHQYQVNEFRTAITLVVATTLGPQARLTWVSEYVLRERNRRVQTKCPRHAPRPSLVLADGLFSFVDYDGRRQFFFLEIDRGTESLWRLASKAKGYIDLHQTDRKRTLHNVPSFRVLIVTTSPTRLFHMRARIANIGECLNMFWFAPWQTEDADTGKVVTNINAERILNPIWHRITDSQLHSLLD